MRPMTQVVQMQYTNPQASQPMYIPVAVVCNTAEEDLKRNIEINSARDLEWVKLEEPHSRKAIMVGGGPSLAEHLEKIEELQREGGAVFAMNAASGYLTYREIDVDYQVIVDAKPETALLVDLDAKAHLFGSQSDPSTFDKVQNPIVWHLEIGDVEKVFPPERVERGGYVLTGGGGASGNAALCVAYAMGYREFHLFGYDSSHRGEASHAYPQQMNQFMPCVDVKWGKNTYKTSLAMKSQAEKFQLTAQALKQAGCDLHLYGDGLLQAMYLTAPSDLSEREKYTLMWQLDDYRNVSPGELAVPHFLEIVKPHGLIVDFGCGTGRAGIALDAAGYDVYLVDFTDNCRDDEALRLPFLEWDLCHPCPLRVGYGFCSDMMEHIPPADVDKVIGNVMASAENVFFQISTMPDCFGMAIGTPLHLTVQPHGWWKETFERLGFGVSYENEAPAASQFVIRREL